MLTIFACPVCYTCPALPCLALLCPCPGLCHAPNENLAQAASELAINVLLSADQLQVHVRVHRHQQACKNRWKCAQRRQVGAAAAAAGTGRAGTPCPFPLLLSVEAWVLRQKSTCVSAGLQQLHRRASCHFRSRTLVLHAPLELDDDLLAREIIEEWLRINGHRLQAGGRWAGQRAIRSP